MAPNAVSYNAVLSACGSTGLTDVVLSALCTQSGLGNGPGRGEYDSETLAMCKPVQPAVQNPARRMMYVHVVPLALHSLAQQNHEQLESAQPPGCS